MLLARKRQVSKDPNIEDKLKQEVSLIQKILFWFITDPNAFKKSGNRNYSNLTIYNFVYLFGGKVHVYKSITYHVLISYICVISSIIFFLIFLAKWYWLYVSPAVVVIFIYLWLLVSANFLYAAFSDPGIYPRNVHYVSTLPEDYRNWFNLPAVGNKEVTLKYCTTCRNWKPPRCHHCIVCNSCINDFDHHCMWINNCVGLRNYTYFFNFISLSTLSSIYLNIMAYYYIIHNHFIRGGGIFLIVFSQFTMIYPFLLMIFHLYLTMSGLKTKEYLNRVFSNHLILRNDISKNPFYQKGFFKNFLSSIFRPTGFSFITFDSVYEDVILLSDLPPLDINSDPNLESVSSKNQSSS